jgi:hypothetical protein
MPCYTANLRCLHQLYHTSTQHMRIAGECLWTVKLFFSAQK